MHSHTLLIVALLVAIAYCARRAYQDFQRGRLNARIKENLAQALTASTPLSLTEARKLMNGKPSGKPLFDPWGNPLAPGENPNTVTKNR